MSWLEARQCGPNGLPPGFVGLQVLPLVVQSLPMLSQRATYIRAFIWAMPERCQQVGGVVWRPVGP